ncbi:MAG: UbiD family decarboxylase [Candidatus Altiarchaeota archaeon]
MSMRAFLDELDRAGQLVKFDREVDPYLEMARVLMEYDGKAVLFTKVKGSEYKVAAGLCSSRENFAKALGIKKEDLLFKIADVIGKPTKPKAVKKGACQEVVEKDVDLSKMPILTHCTNDLGPYVSAGVWVSSNKDSILNLAYHRASPIAKNKLVARICHRDTYKNLQAQDPLPVAICLGLHPTISLAASISAKSDLSEYDIANTMKPVELVKCKTNDLLVPADAEIILEGTLTQKERAKEGPFPDITGTADVVREEPVVTINCITHRKDPIYQGLLPAYNEHRLLMGMPKEPTIYNAVKEVADVKNVLLTVGGCSWFHAIVQISKKNDDDGKKAADAAFKGHGSLKHCIVVDDDINIYSPDEIEWAIATRVQADKRANIFKGPGSSLDCTAECMEGSDRRQTAKVALDATIPSSKNKQKFLKVKLGE